tara:strand:- start:4018 stop:8259 length:4242 start_codon:yes stop_codon:yes gene_type:complete
MPVIRQKPERLTQPINVTRTNTGGAELWETISNNASELTNIVLKKREAQSINQAQDIANLYSNDEITALDPVTNEPKILSEYNFNPQADAAFEQIIQQRFSDTINNSIQLKDKELYQNSPTAEAYKKSMSQYLAELSNGVENGAYKNLIESVGTQRLSLTHLNFLAEEKKANQEKIQRETSLIVNSKVDDYINNLDNNVDLKTLANSREDLFNRLQPAVDSGSITFPQKQQLKRKIQIAEAGLFLRSEYIKLKTERKKAEFINGLVKRPEDYPFFKVLDTKSRNSVIESISAIKRTDDNIAQIEAKELKNLVSNKLTNVNELNNQNNYLDIYNENPKAYARVVTDNQIELITILDQYKKDFSEDDYNKTVNNILTNTYEPLIQDLIHQTKNQEEKSLYKAILSRGNLHNVDVLDNKAERILSDIFKLKSVYKRLGLESPKAFKNLSERYNNGTDNSSLEKITKENNLKIKQNNLKKFNKELNINLEIKDKKSLSKAIEYFNNIVITGTADQKKDATLILRDNLKAEIDDLGFGETQAILEHLQLDGNSELPLSLKAQNIINAINDTEGDFKSKIITNIKDYVQNFRETASFKTKENEANLLVSQEIDDFIKNYFDNDIHAKLINMPNFKTLGEVAQNKFRTNAQDILENLNVIGISVLDNDEIISLTDYVNADTKNKFLLKKDLTPRALVIAERLDANLDSTFAGGADTVTMNDGFKNDLKIRQGILKAELKKQQEQKEKLIVNTNWENGILAIDNNNEKQVEELIDNLDLFGVDGLFGDGSYDSNKAKLLLQNGIIGNELKGLLKQIVEYSDKGEVGEAIPSLFINKDGQRISITENQFAKVLQFVQTAYNNRNFDQWGMKHDDIALIENMSDLMVNQGLNTFDEIVRYNRIQNSIPTNLTQTIKQLEKNVGSLTNQDNNEVDGKQIYPDSFMEAVAAAQFGKTSENEKENILNEMAQYWQPEYDILKGLVNTGNDFDAIHSNKNIASSIMRAALENNVTITPKTVAMYMNNISEALEHSSVTLNKQAGGNFKVIITGESLAQAVFPDEIINEVLDFVKTDAFSGIHSDSWHSSISGPIDYLLPDWLDGNFTGKNLSIWNQSTDAFLKQNIREVINTDGTKKTETASRFNLWKGAVDALVPDKFFGKPMFWQTTVSPDRDLFLEWAFGSKSKEMELRTYLGTISNDPNNPSYQALKKWLKDNYNYDMETMRVSLMHTEDGFVMRDSTDNIILHSKDDPDGKFKKGDPVIVNHLSNDEKLLDANKEEIKNIREGNLADYKSSFMYLSKEDLLARQKRITEGLEKNKILYDSSRDLEIPTSLNKIINQDLSGKNISLNKKFMKFIAKGRVGSVTNNLTDEKNMILNNDSIPLINWFKKNANTIPYKNNKPAFKFKKIIKKSNPNVFKNKTNVFK